MKQFLVAFLVMLFTGVTYAQAEQDSLAKANAFYKNSKYNKAISLYNTLLEQGFESEALYYNLGNAYYKNGQIAQSILNYERALLLDPDDEDAQQNLNIAGLSTVDRFEVMPEPLIRSAYKSVFRLLSPSGWAYLSIGALMLFLVAIVFYFFTDYQKLGFSTGVAGLLLCFFTVGMAFQHSRYLQNNQAAIVMQASSYAKSGPSAEAEDVFILHEGTKVNVIEAFDDWQKIRLPDGKIGWLPKADLGLVNTTINS